MQVTINIDSTNVGETLLDLFKNLSSEKKEELALSVMKEWLQSPEFFEERNKEQIIIDEFKKGIRQPYYYGSKYDENTPDETIMRDEKFKKALETYRNSKQIFVEDIKNEIVSYYKKYIKEQIIDNDRLNKIKEESYNEVAKQFPSIVIECMMLAFISNIKDLQGLIFNSANRSLMNDSMISAIRQKLNI